VRWPGREAGPSPAYFSRGVMVPKTDLLNDVPRKWHRLTQRSAESFVARRPLRSPNSGADSRILPGCASRFIRADHRSEPPSGPWGQVSRQAHPSLSRAIDSLTRSSRSRAPSKILTRIGSITMRRSADRNPFDPRDSRGNALPFQASFSQSLHVERISPRLPEVFNYSCRLLSHFSQPRPEHQHMAPEP
jgi:hypothetical protein